MLKNEILVTLFSKQSTFLREIQRPIYTLSFHELETKYKRNRKQNNACNWTLLGCEIGQHGGDLLNITNEHSDVSGDIN
jgi:hypothetical protein